MCKGKGVVQYMPCGYGILSPNTLYNSWTMDGLFTQIYCTRDGAWAMGILYNEDPGLLYNPLHMGTMLPHFVVQPNTVGNPSIHHP